MFICFQLKIHNIISFLLVIVNPSKVEYQSRPQDCDILEGHIYHTELGRILFVLACVHNHLSKLET